MDGYAEAMRLRQLFLGVVLAATAHGELITGAFDWSEVTRLPGSADLESGTATFTYDSATNEGRIAGLPVFIYPEATWTFQLGTQIVGSSAAETGGISLYAPGTASAEDLLNFAPQPNAAQPVQNVWKFLATVPGLQDIAGKYDGTQFLATDPNEVVHLSGGTSGSGNLNGGGGGTVGGPGFDLYLSMNATFSDLRIVAVPEPGESCTIMAIGLCLLAGFRRNPMRMRSAVA